MSETNINTIWKPNVTPTEVPVPYPNTSCKSSQRSNVNQQEHYTKTSLAHDVANSFNSTTRQFNQRILDSSQMYNSSPKPFVRQSSLSEPNKQIEQHQGQAKLFRQANSFNLQVEDSRQQKAEEGAKMSPKLVHQQYNSPANLYSMSNIRKAIEAHSEMIAPGVKGINFMKPETPVEERSEVLKLIKEEEEQKRLQKQPAPKLPATQANNNGPFTQPSQVPMVNRQQASPREQALHGYPQQYYQTKSAVRQNASMVSGASITQSSQMTPKCFECGQAIVGPFAKLQDRFIHPQCFNCSTCGTSLKNSGYFTINDKLYCDIHARQVANVMRLNYNFEPNKQAVVGSQPEVDNHNHHQRPELPTQQVLVGERKSPQVVLQPEQKQQPLPTTVRVEDNQNRSPVMTATTTSHCTHCCSARNNGQATTISTMFSGLDHHNCKQYDKPCRCNGGRSEIRWTWRPSANHASDLSNCQHQKLIGSQNNTTESHSSGGSIMTNRSALVEHRNKYESHLTAANSTTGGSDRIPFCCNCQGQILGPYILAGKSTWCKPCSQNSFVCNSCNRSLLNIGFIEDAHTGKHNCEHCFENYLAPTCSKCQTRIKGDCLTALGKQWHPTCFVCGHCRCPFGNSSFYLEDNVPYCERDWNLLFTTKCYACGYPIQAGDKWILALERNYHSDCFRCTGCQVKLEGSTFFCKAGKPYCRMHAK